MDSRRDAVSLTGQERRDDRSGPETGPRRASAGRRRIGRVTCALSVLGGLAAVAIWLAADGERRFLGNANALWEIVHGECVPHQRGGEGPAPCSLVDLQGGVEKGYAILKDLRGIAQFLLIPTARITGIESPVLLDPGVTNYFAKAWHARTFVEGRLGHPLDRRNVSLAVNSQLRRTQGQLHIHIDCVRRDVRDTLDRVVPLIGDDWAPLGELLAGRQFRAMRVLGTDLGARDPFDLLARDAGARSAMGERSLAVVGADFPGEGPGFVILNGRVTGRFGTAANAEILQDHACGVAAEHGSGGPTRPAF
jgi:CDP-diacylglycerol pyrophosphatase